MHPNAVSQAGAQQTLDPGMVAGKCGVRESFQKVNWT
jgi:hypothetical protein